MYNTLATAFAIGGYGAWEKDIQVHEKKNSLVVDYFFPFLYKNTRDEELFTQKKFFAWSGISLLQSLVVYGLPILVYNNMLMDGGKTNDLWAVSMCGYITAVNLHYL